MAEFTPAWARKEKPDDYATEYSAWQNEATPATQGALLRKLQPAIDKGLRAYVGSENSPNLRSQARQLALDAVKTYDPSRNVKLTTHVINHLQGLRRLARKQQQILRVPERVTLDQQYLHKTSGELEEQLGRPPTVDELADHTGLSPKRINYVRKFRPPSAESAFIFNTPDNEGTAPAVDGPETDIVVRAVYDDLDDINKQILTHTLGLWGGQKLSNQAIAAKLKITPGAVSQRKAAMQRMLDELADAEAF